MRKLLFLVVLTASIGTLWAIESVRILPLRGPIGTVAISPGNGIATAYRMDFPGQKSICFKMAAAVDVYISSTTTFGTTNSYPLFEKGEALCMDLQGGATIYFEGVSSGADIRAIFSR